ncbi:mannose-6-phosphate receptor binding protein 1 isoform X1 [Anguilla rostrata]|uniref:mannose-6-phosphate receptor binding protein 1 isoform X1 n=1 Tax=Anguilla rostrata TaxID=7938 RepID=UPI0030D27A13
MAEAEKSPEVSAAAEEPESMEQQSVMSRLGNLPFVSSACGMVSSAYTTTKEGVPLLRGVMGVAESGVQMLGSVATSGSKPLLDRLEPQIAVVNEYAMKGLDKVEQNIPILHQPADKVMSDTVGKVYQSVSGAKEAVTGAVMGAVEMTRAAVSGGLNTVMGSRVGQMVSSGMGVALSHSEDWVEHNLPLTERELAAVGVIQDSRRQQTEYTCAAALAEPAPDAEAVVQSAGSSSPSSYFVRLGKLSSKVQERALEQSLAKAQRARDVTRSAAAQIGSTLDLLEGARATLATANAHLGGASEQLQQRWAEWQQALPREREEEKKEGQGEEKSEGDQGEQLEWRALSMVRGLSGQVQAACSGVVSSAQGLPGAVQEQLANARQVAQELHLSLGNTSTLSPHILEQTRLHLAQVQRSLDGVTEYLLNNTPLNWLVGPFAPQITEGGEGEPGDKGHP